MITYRPMSGRKDQTPLAMPLARELRDALGRILAAHPLGDFQGELVLHDERVGTITVRVGHGWTTRPTPARDWKGACGEIYVVTGGNEALRRKVEDLNDYPARQVIAQRMEAMRRKGRATENDFADVRDEIEAKRAELTASADNRVL